MDATSPEEQERVLLRELAATNRSCSSVHASWSGPRPMPCNPRSWKHSGGSIRDLGGHRRGTCVTWSAVWRRSSTRPARSPPSPRPVVIRPEVTGAVVERLEDGEFRVLGRDVERVVALNDVTTADGAGLHRLPAQRSWVSTECSARAGASEGDVVWIGEFSFEYQPDL